MALIYEFKKFSNYYNSINSTIIFLDFYLIFFYIIFYIQLYINLIHNLNLALLFIDRY